MPWKLDLRAQLPSQRRSEREQRRTPHNIGVSLLLLGTLLAVVYARRGPAIASLPASLAFGVLPVQSAGTEQILVVRNQGSAPLNVRDAVVAGNQAGDFKVINNMCSAGPTLPNQACQITLRFQPLAGGERRATLILADDANDSPQSVPLTGTGTERADLTITPAALNFADQTTGAVSDGQPITLTNTGDAPVTVSEIALADETNSFVVEPGPCRGATIAVGQSCTVTVRFKPVDTGNQAARLVIRDSTGDDSHQVPLSGNGTVTPSAGVRLTPAPLDFGKQELGKTAMGTVTIASTGKAPLKTNQVQISGEGASEFVAENKCADSELDPGAECRLQVRFTPRAQGQHVARLSISNNASNGPQEIALIGYGVLSPPPPSSSTPGGVPALSAPRTGPRDRTTQQLPVVPLVPRVLAHPEECRFGRQEIRATSAAQRLTLTSVGTGPAQIQGFSLEGQFPQDFSIGDVNCRGRSLAPRDECSLTVTFAPQSPLLSAPPPDRTAELVIPIAGGSPVRVALTGTAIAPPRAAQPGFTANPSEVAFGGVQVGTQSPSQPVTLSNPGPDPIQIRASMPSGGHGDFRVTGSDCRNSTIPAHGSCAILLAFSPQGAGNMQGDLTLASDSPVQIQPVRLSGSGLPKSLATGFTVSPAQVDFGRVQVGAQTEGRPIVLGNPGPDPIQLRASLPGGNGGDFRFSPGNCQNGIIPARGSCTVSLAFAPKDAGNRQAELTLASNLQVQSVRLGGTGLGKSSPPATMGFIISPSQIDFGRTPLGGQAQSRPITLTNPGTVPVQIHASMAGGNGGDFRVVGSNCQNLTIPAQGSCVISMAFVPQEMGNRQAGLTLASTSQVQSVRLSGVGLPKSGPPVEEHGWCCVQQPPPNYTRSSVTQKGAPILKQSTREDCARMQGAYYTDYRIAKGRCTAPVGQLDWEKRLQQEMVESMLR